ncbi:TPA: SynChlorMet cassette protein ScmC [Candidatus Poribacteria bacterium]|nr:SynChlorMet cassette protein ScmC [Candidatus Poribacteria bacterium]
MARYNYLKGYCIQLGDDNNWWITGYEDSIKYADILSEIMRLNECPMNEYPKIVFFNSSNSDQLNENTIQSIFSNSETEWKAYDYNACRIWYGVQSNDVIVEYKSQEPSKDDKYVAMWITLCFVYLKCLKIGALPTHSGLAEYNGKGVLFVAPGGTGKSTTCRRLPSPWKALCDDENLIMPDKDNKFRVHPFPTWSDYFWDRANNKWDIHQSVPLSAIFFLERADNDEVVQLPKDKSSIYMTGTAYQVLAKAIIRMSKDEQSEIMRQVFNNAFDILNSVPVYKLNISLTGRFWEKIEQVLT